MPNMELITSVTVGSGGAASVTLTAIGTIVLQLLTALGFILMAILHQQDTQQDN
jgi:hypothetical protein